MSRGPQTFRQGDVTKAVKAAVAAGVDVKRIEIERDGKIIIVTGHPEIGVPAGDLNEWDAVK